MTDAEASRAASTGEDAITLKLTHHGTTHEFGFADEEVTLSDLNAAITERLSIPAEHQKFLVSPKVGMLKPPYKDPALSLSTLVDKKVQLLAPLPAELSSLQEASAAARAPRPPPVVKAAKPGRRVDHSRAHADVTYTFHKIVPLAYLPRPERSARFLERLRDDAGIRAAMRAHRFSVGVLTEMDPAAHTTHESRTLGLNRNRGEVIELRLRTDAYDGYRDYKTIRKTLCHELAHNVFGEHDRDFWDLTNQIEKEVDRADWTRGGRSVGEEEFYNPDDWANGVQHVDGGGWTGGEFVLGTTATTATVVGAGASAAGVSTAGLSRRELMAQAAEERMKKQKDVEKSEEPK